MVISYAFCNVSAMPIYSEPSHRAEQVNELLFGERVEVLETNEREWARIRCEWDSYEGWCKTGQLTQLSKKEYRKGTRVLTSNHSSKLIFEDSEMLLPMGCDLLGLKSGKVTVAEKTGVFKGKKINTKKAELTGAQIKAAAFQYMNAPYHWGGRTIMGIDCSGLAQMAFKLCGFRIPRDADQQSTEGEVVDFLQHTQCGDLAFFENTEGKIVHVGIILDHQSIIHAADSNGRVFIDKIDQAGIISILHKKRTHNLRVVKRLFS